MAIKFSAVRKVMPLKGGTKEVYCAALLKSKTVGMKEISEALSEASTLNSIDCYAVMMGMTQQIVQHLLQGNVVNVEGLGSFRITAKTHAEATPEEVTAATISGATVNFRPSVEVKKHLRHAKFVKQG